MINLSLLRSWLRLFLYLKLTKFHQDMFAQSEAKKSMLHDIIYNDLVLLVNYTFCLWTQTCNIWGALSLVVFIFHHLQMCTNFLMARKHFIFHWGEIPFKDIRKHLKQKICYTNMAWMSWNFFIVRKYLVDTHWLHLIEGKVIKNVPCKMNVIMYRNSLH